MIKAEESVGIIKQEHNIKLEHVTSQTLIRKLPQQVIAKIAAGEVINSTTSVIKELVENSIDAGSTSISIMVSNDGFSIISVEDNGCGI